MLPTLMFLGGLGGLNYQANKDLASVGGDRPQALSTFWTGMALGGLMGRGVLGKLFFRENFPIRGGDGHVEMIQRLVSPRDVLDFSFYLKKNDFGPAVREKSCGLGDWDFGIR